MNKGLGYIKFPNSEELRKQWKPLRDWLDSLTNEDLKDLPTFKHKHLTIRNFTKFVKYMKANGRKDDSAMCIMGTWQSTMTAFREHVDANRQPQQERATNNESIANFLDL